MDEFVQFSSQESSTGGNFTVDPPTDSPGISAFNKYVVVGILCIFVSLLLAAVFVHLVRGKFLSRDTSLLYAQVTSDDDDTTLLDDGSDDDPLYTTCQLHVVDEDTAGLDFEYDSSSLDGGLSSTQRKLLVNVLRGDVRSDVPN